MMYRNLFSAIALLVLPVATASNNDIRLLQSTRDASVVLPIPPRQDPFYSAPQGFESTLPGTILRFRKAPGNLTTTFNASSAVYNIVFRTTNSLYQPAWAVTTVFAPLTTTAHPNGSASLLSYQIPYNTADVDLSPSYDVYSPSFSTGLVLQDVQAALSHGWFVNIPDFEGPTTSFASGVLEGHAVIDSIRAALTLAPPGAQTALWGYSGGSIASEWAAELAIQYAPELQLSGVAIGGLVANTTDFLSRIDNTQASWLIPSVILGLTNQYPNATEYIMSALRTAGPYNATAFLATENYTFPESAAAYNNVSVLNEFFTNGNATIFDSPVVRSILNTDGQMGSHGVPNVPLYVYKAVKDEYSATEYTDALVESYCLLGANVTYRRNLRGNHLDEYTNGDAGAFAWLTQILNGGGATSSGLSGTGCDIQNVTVGTEDHEPFYLPPM